MSDITISIDRVARMFKRYRNPRYRVMEALGLRLPKNAYDEFWALRDISFTVRRGERVALIGRNGAGKSTLLNIVCGRLRPTSGTVTVQGRIQALMELGTGFHPDFTGRENVLSSLAYQGISGAKALALLDEVIDFAELDDFIDQPIKTYSAGMYARLAFSTATAFDPNVLIIDEVLGAGDAYFAAKCTERMRRLTLETGATVLFVSHDLASAERLCQRAIWIERGQMHMSGSTREVSKSYHASILEQEESRLRARTSMAISRMRGDTKNPDGHNLIQVRLVTESTRLPEGSHPIRRLSLATADGVSVEVRPGSAMDNDQCYDAYLFVDPEWALWSPPKNEAGEMVRCVENTGGKYPHAQVYFKVPLTDREAPLELEIEHAAATTERLAVEIYDSREPAGYRRIGLLSEQGSSWRVDHFSIPLEMFDRQSARAHDMAMTEISVEGTRANFEQDKTHHSEAETEDLQQTQDKWATSEAEFVEISPWGGVDSRPQFVFGLGEPVTFRIVTDVRAPLPVLWLAASFYDQFGNRVFVTVQKFSGGAAPGQHQIDLTLTRPNLRQGEYVGTFELLPEFEFNWRGAGRFPYLCLWDRCVYFKVDEGYRGVIELGLVDMACSATSPTLAVAQPIAAVRTDPRLDRPTPLLVREGRF